ncbi:putative nucleolar protein 58 [Amylocarpus encephaloides]|uniref:Nucleolar protein 58 n=1 Tax=Amylocarpus encephaloides TaxID=45428 RepID=A0A9P7YCS6_9HELO|nr:putative nucleolar protein 58 [Amylocarpus encephaloides]
MGLFVLTETSAGFALFKADKKALKKSDSAEVETAEGINGLLKLKHFEKFDSAATALEEVSSITEGKVSPMLAKLLETLKDEKKASLAVADPKLGQSINKLPGLNLTPISDSTTNDVYRAIREHLPSLIPGLAPENISTMALGLSHSLSRHKLKFSPDKVDVMIVQAISLLDDLDKELNTYAMRVKEWYGWHFPEMGRIVNDNLAYARIIMKVGMRANTSNTDLTDILPEEIETAVKAAAEVSMGTEITEEDLENIKLLAEQVVGYTEYRQQLSSYLTSRMQALAPNATELVGELVGARLISHAGSIMSLAKSPASTIQILGAEKALFRALKTKHDTPKYGLIYHASLVGQATGKNKGKIARMLAAKTAIGLRVDALSDWSAGGEGKGDDVDEEERSLLGVQARLKIERQLRVLEGKPLLPRGVAVGPNGAAVSAPSKWEIKEAKKYNADADGLAGDEPAPAGPVSEKKSKKVKKDKKSKKEETPVKPKKIIEEVSSDDELDEDKEMADVEAGLGLAPPSLNGTKTKPVANGAEDKSSKKKDRKEKKAEKPSAEEVDTKNAAAAGLSLDRYRRKLERGQIIFGEDGLPVVTSKKDLKKQKKAEKKEKKSADSEASSSKKRKHEDDVEKSEKKKKKSKALERGYRNRSPRRDDRRQDESKHDSKDQARKERRVGAVSAGVADKEDKFDVASKFGPSTSFKKSCIDTESNKKATGPAPVQQTLGEPMIIVHVNDRLGTKAAIPCLASDPIKLFKAQVAARIGRQPHEILLKRQGERPFKDQLTLEDYGVSNGVQIDLEIDTGE